MTINEENTKIQSPLMDSKPLSDNLLSVDEALKAAGDQGKYQIRMFIFFALQWMIVALTLMGQPFLFKYPDFLCSESGGPPTSCEADEKTCGNDTIVIWPTPESPNTLVKYFELYCDREYLVTIVQASFFVTGAVGIVVFSYLADKVGRFPILAGAFILAAITIFAASFAHAYWLFGTLLAICGIGINVYTTLCFVILAESASETFNRIASILVLLSWSVGEMLTAPLAWAADSDWSLLCLWCVGVPLLLMTGFYFWIYESPKFLIIKGDFKGAKEVIYKIAKTNGKELEDFSFKEESKNGQESPSTKEKKSGYGYLDLFKFKSLRYSTIGGAIIFFAIYFVYYGTTFALSGIAGNIYVNVLVASGAEFVAYLVTVPVATMIKRKVSFIGCFLIAGVFAFSFFFLTIPDECSANNVTCIQKTLQTVFAGLTRFGIAIPFCLIYIYMNELFPTAVRSLGNGFCQTIARIGSILSPVSNSLSRKYGISPMIPIGVMALIGALAVIPMKETFGAPLKHEVEEEGESNNENDSADRADVVSSSVVKHVDHYN